MQCGAALFALACACTPKTPPTTVTEAWERPATRPTNDEPEAPQAAPRVVAVVNGHPVSREWLANELIAAHGINLLLQRIWLELVKEEAAKAGITANLREIDTEYDLTLGIGAGEAGGAEKRQAFIDQWRRSRGVSEQELRLAMERQALLRKLAARRLSVSEQMLREEFARLYGTKVECRQIVLPSPRDADRLRPAIEAGEDFATLARRYSADTTTAPQGGLMPPFARNDEAVPELVREAAFRMSPGEVSNPISARGKYVILKLERRLTAELIKFESVRASVEESLRKRLLPVEMEKLFGSLQRGSTVKINDAVLRRLYQAEIEAGRVTGPGLEK